MPIIGPSGFNPASAGCTFSVQSDLNVKQVRGLVSRFSSTVSRGFLEQTALSAAPHAVTYGPNGLRSIQFDGEEDFLEFRGLSSPTHVHTLIFVVKPDRLVMPGYLFSAEIGPEVCPKVMKPGWQVYTATYPIGKPLNGDITLGCRHNRAEGFFRGEMAYFGYIPGEPHETVIKPFLEALRGKYGIE